MGIGVGSNATGSLSITNGGAVNIGVTSPSLTADILIGGEGSHPGGTGSVTVNDGSLTLSGTNTFLNVGRNQGSGTMTVEGGGTVSGVFTLEVARDGSTGSLKVDGAGSTVTLSGTSTTSGAFLGVGVVDTPALAATLGPSTVGNLTVQNGGKITVDTDNNVNGGISAGVNGGTGNITVTGAGSQIAITGNNGNLTPETGGGAGIGRSGTGTLNVLAGGRLVVNDTGTAGQAGMAIGGTPTQVANGEQPGTGTVTVSGAGSQLNVQSPHGFITSGYSGTGTLNVLNGGAVTAEGLTIGRNTGSVGTVSLNGNGSSITLSGNDIGGGNGARLQVGGRGSPARRSHSTFSTGPIPTPSPRTASSISTRFSGSPMRMARTRCRSHRSFPGRSIPCSSAILTSRRPTLFKSLPSASIRTSGSPKSRQRFWSQRPRPF